VSIQYERMRVHIGPFAFFFFSFLLLLALSTLTRTRGPICCHFFQNITEDLLSVINHSLSIYLSIKTDVRTYGVEDAALPTVDYTCTLVSRQQTPAREPRHRPNTTGISPRDECHRCCNGRHCFDAETPQRNQRNPCICCGLDGRLQTLCLCPLHWSDVYLGKFLSSCLFLWESIKIDKFVRGSVCSNLLFICNLLEL
jgi:hypothetical protein